VTFNPDVAATPVIPVAVDPARVGVGWFNVVSGNPDISIAVPAVVACVPCPVGVLMWWWRYDFVRSFGGTDTDNDLSLSHACGEQEGAGNCREEFLHLAISLSY
jgi:hypothetical protein